MTDRTPHIGTLKETPLHAALKAWYHCEGDSIEVPLDGYVIDLVRGDLLIEVQTSGFSSLKKKATTLLETGYRLRIVHPVAVDSTIIKIDEHGAVVDRRLSPKHGKVSDVFAELVSFPELLAVDGLEIDVILVVEEQVRYHVPGQAWRRHGWTILERRLVEVLESRLIRGVDQLVELLPQQLPDPFTTVDLSEGLETTRRLAQQVAYCLRAVGAAEAVGRRGRAIEYRLVG